MRQASAQSSFLQPSDSSAAATAAQAALLREASVAERLERVHSLTRTTLELSRRAIRRRLGDVTELEVLLAWAELHYGQELANAVRRYIDEL